MVRGVTSVDDRQDVVEDDAPDEVIAYCSRPMCRKEYRRVPAPGRRQKHCSEFCRRAAHNELRQTRSRLKHYEDLVKQLRIDVAAFGRSSSDDDEAVDINEQQRVAEAAIARASGVVKFTRHSTEDLAVELRLLHDAVAPVIQQA